MQVTARNLETARIVISSDQEMIRSALRGLLESQGVAVVAECANRPEALSATLLAKPHLILLDFDLCTRCTGVSERIGALLHAACGTPVLILTARDDCQAALAALEHGAVGFVMKSRSPETLHRAIRAGIAGETWLERSTMAAVFRSAARCGGRRQRQPQQQRERPRFGTAAHAPRARDRRACPPRHAEQGHRRTALHLLHHGAAPPHDYLRQARGFQSARADAQALRRLVVPPAGCSGSALIDPAHLCLR